MPYLDAFTADGEPDADAGGYIVGRFARPLPGVPGAVVWLDLFAG